MSMVTLGTLKQRKVYVELSYVADVIEAVGLSYTVPTDSDGKVSLPYAIALVCGIGREPYSDDFYTLLEAIPNKFKPSFIMCWEALEMEVGLDLVVWSESVGSLDTIDTIRRLAKTIELS